MSTNVKLLHKIADRIETDPAHFDLGFFAAPAGRVDVGDDCFYKRVVKDEPLPTCGTIACLAGWAIIESDPELRRSERITEGDLLKSIIADTGRLNSLSDYAMGLLGITSDDIFFADKWRMRRSGRPTAANVVKQLRLLAKGKGKFADHYVE